MMQIVFVQTVEKVRAQRRVHLSGCDSDGPGGLLNTQRVLLPCVFAGLFGSAALDFQLLGRGRLGRRQSGGQDAEW
jgi:hypothetical protein